MTAAPFAFTSTVLPRVVRRITTRAACSACTPPLRAPSPTTAYIHLPFCRQRCAYCSFPIVVQSRDATSAASAEDVYLSLLLTEISATARAYAGRPRKPLTSVYLGGGTPSLISAVNLHRLLARVDDAFGIDADAEITCEMDPATFDSAKAAAFRSAGVNRASVGAQSFDDDLLATCRRAHRRTDIYDAMTFLRRAGFDNVSVDLISGLPGQSLDAWSRTLACAIALEPEHISTYDLELDEGTRFSALYRAGVSPLPSDDAAADMLTMTAARLADAGYDHYEVSSYSKRPATQSRHNLSYWHSREFYGFGMGATSLLAAPDCAQLDATFRFDRPRTMASWTDYVRSLERRTEDNSDLDAAALFPGVAARTLDDRIEDWLINALRLMRVGVDFKRLDAAFGPVTASRVESAFRTSGLAELGLIAMDLSEGVDASPIRLRMTEEGAKFETSVLSGILSEAVWKHQGKRGP